MVSKIIDSTKQWVFHFGGLVKNGIPLKIQEKEGIISFFVPLDGSRGIEIEMISLKEAEQIIEGKYAVWPSNHKETVVFKILEVGKLLGTPKGSMSRDAWTITSKD
jgi:hypothetical protein